MVLIKKIFICRNTYNERWDCYRFWPVASFMLKILFDMLLGNVHPKHEDIIYPINYGFIPKIPSGDGDELDVNFYEQ